MIQIITNTSTITDASGNSITALLAVRVSESFEYDDVAERKKVAAGFLTTLSIVNGKLNSQLSLIPTSGSGHDKSNIFYTATIYQNNNIVSQEYWLLPASITSPIEYTDIELSNPANKQPYIPAPFGLSTGETGGVDLSSYATKTWVQYQQYLTAIDIADFATEQWVLNKQYLTATDIADFATEQWVTNNFAAIDHEHDIPIISSNFNTNFIWEVSDDSDPTPGKCYISNYQGNTSITVNINNYFGFNIENNFEMGHENGDRLNINLLSNTNLSCGYINSVIRIGDNITIIIGTELYNSYTLGDKIYLEFNLDTVSSSSSNYQSFQIADGLGKALSGTNDLSNWQNSQNIIDRYGYPTWVNGGTQNIGTYRNLLPTVPIDTIGGNFEIGQLYNESGTIITSGTTLTAYVYLIEQSVTGQSILASITAYSTYTGLDWNHENWSQQNYVHQFILNDTTFPGMTLAGKRIGISLQISSNTRKATGMIQMILKGWEA